MSSKRTMSFTLLAVLSTQPSFADERKIENVKTYERRATENWLVQGIYYPTRERNDACVAFKEWKDGSKLELVKDLKSGELRIWHQAMGWNRINDEKMKKYSLRMNFYDQQGNVADGGEIDYTLINKNTIVISQIDEKRFLKAFVNSNRINFIPEGNVSNTQVYFDGKSSDIANVLADCVKSTGNNRGSAAVVGKNPVDPPNLDLPTKANARYSL